MGLHEGEQVVLNPVASEVEPDTSVETPLRLRGDLRRDESPSHERADEPGARDRRVAVIGPLPDDRSGGRAGETSGRRTEWSPADAGRSEGDAVHRPRRAGRLGPMAARVRIDLPGTTTRTP